jgi:transcriptional regulator with XRE-family HTH domain
MGHVPDNAPLRKRIGERIVAARGDRSQAEIAAALGVTPQAVSRWETGSALPGLSMQPFVARVLGVDWADLFRVDENEAA